MLPLQNIMSCRTGVRQSIGRNKVGVCYRLYLCRHDKLMLVDFRFGEHILNREFPAQAHNQQRMIHRCDVFYSAACRICRFAGVWAESSGCQGLGPVPLQGFDVVAFSALMVLTLLPGPVPPRGHRVNAGPEDAL